MINLAHNYRLMLATALMSASMMTTAAPVQKDYSLKLTKPGEAVQLDVEVRFGSIVVEGYDGDTVEIQAIFKEFDEKTLNDPEYKEMMGRSAKRYRNNSDKRNSPEPRSSKGLKRVVNSSVHLNIEESDNEVEIESELDNRLIDLRIRVPKASSVDAELFAGGDITVKSLSGSLELGNHRGGVNAYQVDGPIVAETWRSDIVIEYGSFDKSNPSSFASHLGNIDITVPEKSVKASIMAQSYRGEILSGLNTEFVPSDEVHKSDDGHQEITLGGAMVAKINGGGQTISAQTYSGNIYIRQK